MDITSGQKILKEEGNQISMKPLGFLRALLGSRETEIEEDINLFRLGKQCSQCKKLVYHREAISVCSCYLFAHKDCLTNQLSKANLSECSLVHCKNCRVRVRAIVYSDYFFKINISIGDLVILLICAVLCAASMFYLVNFKNVQMQEMRQQQLKTHTRHSPPLISTDQIISVAVIFVFGTLFWLCLIGMILNRKTVIREIIGTNTEVHVSAFEQLENKIREESCHSNPLKKEVNEL